MNVYAGIVKRNRDSSSQYLQSQMQEAKWMIKNIQQRFSTILRVSQAIVDRQRNFLEYGEVAMKPLVLREIADELGLHESTISRVTTNKYMLTPRGIFELKCFFGSSVATDTGGTCSATAIRALIKKLVEQENPKKPGLVALFRRVGLWPFDLLTMVTTVRPPAPPSTSYPQFQVE